MAHENQSQSEPPPGQTRPSLETADATGLFPVSPADLHSVYQDLAEDITAREDQLVNRVPIDAPYGLADCLQTQQERWKTGVKSLRSLPVLNVYTTVLDDSVASNEELKQLLTGLDATINILDDIIDTADADHNKRITHAVNVAFAHTLVTAHVPANNQARITDLLTQYLTEVFQIPVVERKLFAQFQATDSAEWATRLDIAKSIYDYRSYDISGFARIPAIIYDLDDRVAERVVADLKTIRARQLLYKDLADIERDLRDGDETVVLELLRTTVLSSGQVTEFMDALHDEFVYSSASDAQYQALLTEFEHRPSCLDGAVRTARQTVDRLTDNNRTEQIGDE